VRHSHRGGLGKKLSNMLSNARETKPTPISVYATSWCPDCKLAKAVLEQYGVEYTWIDIDRNPAAIETVLRLNGGYRTVPTIIFPDGRVLVEPSRRQLEQALAESADAARGA
jgi:mycoredoxin